MKRFSKLPVYVGARESMYTDSISISPVKLDELVDMYEKMYTFTHTIWRNLPNPTSRFWTRRRTDAQPQI